MRTVAGPTLFVAAAAAVFLFLGTPRAEAQSSSDPGAAELAEQIRALKREYEARIGALEAQLSVLESKAQDAGQGSATPARAARPASDNAFNPAIGVVLNGMLSEYSADESEIPGFPMGHESERPARGLALGHSEIAMSSNIDDKFRGNLTLGLGVHPGEPTELELEEAYIQTLPGAGLPEGMRIKAGRALWTFGYLNEHHRHGDDFADRPLPYRAFLDSAYNDDGGELSLVLPADLLYTEIGGGLFRGDDTPFGGSSNGHEAWSAYARFGGDFGRDTAWRIGGYILSGDAQNRGGGHAHADAGHGEHDHEEHMHHEDEHEHEVAMHHEDEHDHEEDMHHEDEHDHEEDMHHEDEHDHEDGHHDEHGHAEFFSDGLFTGDARLFALDFRSTWAPTGNARERELILQAEHFWRKERGIYALAEGDEEDGESEYFDTTSRGWYAQAVYKFKPRWRIGARYSQLHPADEMELDHDPTAVAAMIDWTNSEFSRIRLQFTRESFAEDEHDNQIMLQYITSLGAHPAHTF